MNVLKNIEQIIAESSSSAFRFNAYLEGTSISIPIFPGANEYRLYIRSNEEFVFLGISKAG